MQFTWGGILFIVIIIAVVVGIIFLNKWRKGEKLSFRLPWFGKTSAQRSSEVPNSLNIYPNKVVFEYVKKPLGMTGKCFNDSKEYYIHEADNGKLKEFILPDDNDDERYYNPREFANVVEMPACKKYLEWMPSLFQKVAFGIMAAVIVVEMIVLIILSG